MSLKYIGAQEMIQYSNNVLDYLESGENQKFNNMQTSKPGILTWHFHDLNFLYIDLLFVHYDDGEISGGAALLELQLNDNDIVKI